MGPVTRANGFIPIPTPLEPPVKMICRSSTNSIPTCFAEARAVFAEAMLQKIAKKMALRKLAEANF